MFVRITSKPIRRDGRKNVESKKDWTSVGRKALRERYIAGRTSTNTHTRTHKWNYRRLIDRLVLLYNTDGWINMECLYISFFLSRALFFLFIIYFFFFGRASFVFVLSHPLLLSSSLIVYRLSRSLFDIPTDWSVRSPWGIKFNRKLFFSRRQGGADKLYFPHVGPVQNRDVWSVI